MATVLIVGATGQLGTAVLRRLTKMGHRVRAFVRRGSLFRALEGENVEIAFGDLRDPASVESACRGAETVVATANVVVPRGPYSFRETEEQGYRNLIDSCRRNGVRRFVFMSVPSLTQDAEIPTFRIKRGIERLLVESGLPFTVFRGSLFMDDWFALMGSSIPLRGAEAATLRRPFWFPRVFLAGVGRVIEKRGIALIPGNGEARHAFVALDDVADFLAAAAVRPDGESGLHDLGGPEVLSWQDVVGIFSRVLGRRLRAIHTPAGMYRFWSRVLAPFSPAAANLMAMSWAVAIADTPFDTRETARRFGVALTSAESFLRGKAALPETPK